MKRPIDILERGLRRASERARRLSEKLWVRVSAIAALALVAAGLSTLVGPLLPARLKGVVSPEAAADLLEVLASSMLAVTIFSLSVMVTVHRAVESQWTPRAHRLLASDHVTLSAVSVFVGGWLYALAAQILLDAALVGGTEHVFLFAMTVLVVLLIVYMVMRWVSHLATLGSLAQTGARLEAETRAAFRLRAGAPFLGGHPLGADAAVPEGMRAVRAAATGWVTRVDADALEAAGAEAEGGGVPVHLVVPLGCFVAEGDEIARVAGPDARLDAVRAAIAVGPLRDFDQDPGYGLLAMSEVAQRALSPGVNDPGTAIEMLGRMLRALGAWAPEAPLDPPLAARSAAAADRWAASEDEAPRRGALARLWAALTGAAAEERRGDGPLRPHLWAPPLDVEAMLEAAFAPIARDGAGQVEVVLALLAVLDRVARHDDPGLARAAEGLADDARARAERTLEDPGDLARLRGGPEGAGAAPAGPARPISRVS